MNALAQQAETYTFSFAIIDIRPQLNHLNVVYRFNRILSPEGNLDLQL